VADDKQAGRVLNHGVMMPQLVAAQQAAPLREAGRGTNPAVYPAV
jgi:hypothetical protein